MSLFEAAHWAPSAFNGQPWRFVYAHRDTPEWERLFDVLIPYNQAWVKTASVLMYVISDRFRRAPGKDPVPLRSHAFDAGAAWASLALQAHLSGWAAHGMAGFDVARSYEVLGVADVGDVVVLVEGQRPGDVDDAVGHRPGRERRDRLLGPGRQDDGLGHGWVLTNSIVLPHLRSSWPGLSGPPMNSVD